MKKFFYVLLGFIGLICLLMIISFFRSNHLVEADQVPELRERSPYRFEQVGYFKVNQNRIFTFYVSYTVVDIVYKAKPIGAFIRTTNSLIPFEKFPD